jgi:XTP/dITP diphosphohydrolase
MSKILLATHNPGKILEYREIFKSYPIELVTLRDINITHEPEETGKTFDENAIAKARYYAEHTDLPVLAEDSGLEIDYLNGEPGVYSGRWPGHKATDQELIDIAMSKLQNVPKEKRGAQFRVVVAFKMPRENEVFTGQGMLRGMILEKPIKKIIPGFPFRSIFYVPEIDKVLGEMTESEEAQIGHRSQAMKQLLPIILEKLNIQ